MPNEELIPGQQTPPVEPVVPGEQIIPDPAQTPPVETPPVTPPVTPPAAPSPGEVTDEKRLGGAILKIEELTIAKRALEADLATKSSEIEQLNVQLGTKDIERTVAVGERDKNLETILTEKQALDTEVLALRAYKMKVAMAQKLGAPELITLIDRIPDMQDEEALETVMTDFLSFRQAGIKERETVLLAGVTPPAPPIQNVPAKPTTGDGWKALVASLPLGSKERDQALTDWGDWLQTQPGAAAVPPTA